jgi:hypothetical protein
MRLKKSLVMKRTAMFVESSRPHARPDSYTNVSVQI